MDFDTPISTGILKAVYRAKVDDPTYSMPLVIIALMPLLMFLNIMPLVVAWGIDNNSSNYEPGHFDELASQNVGPWLGWAFLAGSIMCQLGLLNSTMMASQRMLYYFLQTRYPSTFLLSESGATGRSKCFDYLFVDPTPGVPAGLILGNGLITGLAVWIPYAALIELVVLLVAPCIILFLISFVYLKIDRKTMQRPFELSGGVPASVAWVFPPVIVTFAQVLPGILRK